MKVIKRDYKGKKVFVGLDVHKKSYSVAVTCEGVFVKNWSMKASTSGLVNQLERFFEGAEIETAYEAGFSGLALHRYLEKKGIKNTVVNPGSIAKVSANRVKTDKKDARMISKQLSLGLLRCIYIPSLKEEDKRALSRGREQVVRRRQSVGNQIKMKLHHLGVFVSDSRISEAFMKEVETLKLSASHMFILNEMVASWRAESERIKRINKALEAQAVEDPLEEIYRSAPGVGAVSSRVLSNEFGDMKRFKNGRELSASSGLTPSEYSSGDHVKKGHVTRQGNPRVRAVLVEIAWRAISKDLGLREVYENIKARQGSKKAIVAVARKLLLKLRKCLKDGIHWEDTGAVAA